LIEGNPEGSLSQPRKPLASSGRLARRPRRRPEGPRPEPLFRPPGNFRRLHPNSLPRRGTRPCSGNLHRSAPRQAAQPEDPKVSRPYHRLVASSGTPSRASPEPEDPASASFQHAWRSMVGAASSTTRRPSPRQPRRPNRSATADRRPGSTRRSFPNAGCVRFVQPTCGSYFLRFQRTTSAKTFTPPLLQAGPPSRPCSI
jgi:hypothetical protein